MGYITGEELWIVEFTIFIVKGSKSALCQEWEFVEESTNLSKLHSTNTALKKWSNKERSVSCNLSTPASIYRDAHSP
jgi:hypothetical protein